jgi:hypothetical protein
MTKEIKNVIVSGYKVVKYVFKHSLATSRAEEIKYEILTVFHYKKAEYLIKKLIK